MKIYCAHGILDKCLAHEDHIHAYRNVIFAVLFFRFAECATVECYFRMNGVD